MGVRLCVNAKMENVTNKLNILDDLKLFKLNSGYFDKVKVEYIGDSKTPVYIIDDFYENIPEIKKFIFNLPFFEKRFKDNFPGLRIELHLNILFEIYHMLKKLFKNYHLPIDVVKHPPSNCFNLMYSNVDRHNSQTIPHVDIGNYAGVVYLNDTIDCKGGTSFYKHKSSSKEVIENKEEVMDIMTKIDIEKLSGEWLVDTNNEWELLHLVPMKFNRAIFYPSSIFHSAYIKENYFTETYRLTQSIFF